MLLTDQHPHNKSIMVSLLGLPNAGKSSLANYLLGFDLTPVTRKAQTTRNKINCVFTVDRTEVVLMDTPGIHNAGQELNKRMNGQAFEASEGVDLNLILLDLGFDMIKDLKQLRQNMKDIELGRSWLVFTKTDKVNMEEVNLDAYFNFAKELFPSLEKYFAVSPKEGDGVHLLTGALCDEAQPGPHLYPGGEVSNKSERFFAAEYIREQAFTALDEEIPYEVAVVIDDFQDFRAKNKRMAKERPEVGTREAKDNPVDSLISASILVNRPSQRGIVVGKQGAMIKRIGTEARKKIEKMVGGKVRLNLHVKVSPRWFKNNYVLEEVGLPRVQNSARVFRKR